MRTYISRIRLRRGSEADIRRNTYDMGEPVFSRDTKRMVVGDGSTPGGKSTTVVVHSVLDIEKQKVDIWQGDILFYQGRVWVAKTELRLLTVPVTIDVDIVSVPNNQANEFISNKGKPGGYAPLDINSKVPVANLPYFPSNDFTPEEVAGLQSLYPPYYINKAAEAFSYYPDLKEIGNQSGPLLLANSMTAPYYGELSKLLSLEYEGILSPTVKNTFYSFDGTKRSHLVLTGDSPGKITYGPYIQSDFTQEMLDALYYSNGPSPHNRVLLENDVPARFLNANQVQGLTYIENAYYLNPSPLQSVVSAFSLYNTGLTKYGQIVKWTADNDVFTGGPNISSLNQNDIDAITNAASPGPGNPFLTANDGTGAFAKKPVNTSFAQPGEAILADDIRIAAPPTTSQAAIIRLASDSDIKNLTGECAIDPATFSQSLFAEPAYYSPSSERDMSFNISRRLRLASQLARPITRGRSGVKHLGTSFSTQGTHSGSALWSMSMEFDGPQGPLPAYPNTRVFGMSSSFSGLDIGNGFSIGYNDIGNLSFYYSTILDGNLSFPLEPIAANIGPEYWHYQTGQRLRVIVIKGDARSMYVIVNGITTEILLEEENMFVDNVGMVIHHDFVSGGFNSDTKLYHAYIWNRALDFKVDTLDILSGGIPTQDLYLAYTPQSLMPGETIGSFVWRDEMGNLDMKTTNGIGAYIPPHKLFLEESLYPLTQRISFPTTTIGAMQEVAVYGDFATVVGATFHSSVLFGGLSMANISPGVFIKHITLSHTNQYVATVVNYTSSSVDFGVSNMRVFLVN